MTQYAFPKERLISKWNFVFAFVFCYFLTLSLDLLSIDIGVLKLKISHVVALATFGLFAILQKGLVLEKRLFFCFLIILFSMVISALGSVWVFRSFCYSIICIFTFFCYFFLPFNLVHSLDENRVIKIYLATYLIVGSYAVVQFFGSMWGFTLPFSVQTVVLVRGSSLSQEPSFYALYAIPIVAFLNSKWLLTSVYLRKKLPAHVNDAKKIRSITLLLGNLCLLVSTATSAFLSYIVFFLVAMFFRKIEIKRKLIKVSLFFFSFFSLAGCLFTELFKKTFLKFFFHGLKHESFLERFNGIAAALDVFLQHPLLGVGLGGVGPYLFGRDFFPSYSGQISDLDRLLIEKFEPTNVISEILASLGLLGFAAFALLIFVILRPFWKALRHPQLLISERINLISFAISIVVMLICLQINQGLFRGYVWVHLGMGTGYALKVLAKARERKSADMLPKDA